MRDRSWVCRSSYDSNFTERITFDEFNAQSLNRGGRYELHDGIVVEMPKPKGQHSIATGFLMAELILTIIEMGQRAKWTIPRESIVKSSNGKSGYEPDIIVIDQGAIAG